MGIVKKGQSTDEFTGSVEYIFIFLLPELILFIDNQSMEVYNAET